MSKLHSFLSVLVVVTTVSLCDAQTTNYTQTPNHGGAPPGGDNNDIQIKSGSSFASGVTNMANVGPRGNISRKANCGGVPGTDSGIRYADGPGGGSNANDGCSWGSAKQDVFHALCSLPGGSCGSTPKTGSGTVYLTSNTYALASDTIAGICLMGPNDPNYSTPTTPSTCDGKWLQWPATGGVHIIGVTQSEGGTLVGGGSQADTNHPGMWLSGNQGNAIWVQNLQFQYPGRGIVIGVCSDNTTTNACQVVGGEFDNTGEQVGNFSGLGPGWDIAGASYDLIFNNINCSGASANGVNSNLSACMLFDGANNSGTAINIINGVRMGGSSGIKVIPGSSGATLVARNGLLEGDGSHQCMPAVTFTGIGTGAEVSHIYVADCTGVLAPPAVVVNQGYNGNWLRVEDVSSGGIPSYSGPVLISTDEGQDAVIPWLQGAVGPVNGRFIGQVDEARRLFPPVAVRFRNLASSLSAVCPGRTLTTGISDPAGGTGATQLTCTNPGPAIYSVGATLSTGDWIIAGVWTQAPNGYYSGPAPAALTSAGNNANVTCREPNQAFSSTLVAGISLNRYIRSGSIYGGWYWSAVACKVTSGGGALNLELTIQSNGSGFPINIFGAVLNYIPSGTITDDEVGDYAETLTSYSPLCSVGTICGMNIPVNFLGGGTIGSSSRPATVYAATYNTQSAATTSNIPATSMVASTSAMHQYAFDWVVSLTAAGSGCTGNTTVELDAIFTDPHAGGSTTQRLATVALAGGGNGAVGFVASGADTILAKAGTAVEYETSHYAAGSGCIRNPTYQVTPTLVQLW